MAIFTDAEPDRPRRRNGFGIAGGILLALSTIAVVAIAFVPSPFIVEQPGPVFDTLGEVSIGEDTVPLIDIPDHKTYPTAGSLDMLTVSIVGDREQPLNWFEAATAWLDPSKAVVPVDAIYPVGVTVEQSSEESRIQMETSQQEAIAAAFAELDYDFTSTLTVEGLTDVTAAKGILETGDQVLTINGETFTYVSQMRQVLSKNGVDKPIEMTILRNGVEKSVEITPVLSNEAAPAPVIGVLISSAYVFPFDVTIQLENVGGPSAGQMFALGIIDKLTKGKLNGGENVAGTGTISGDGTIGPIGGIRQKLYGALDAGATYFLAPASNCDEVTGHIPDGLSVFAVETLDDSLAALKGISSGDTDALPTCPAA